MNIGKVVLGAIVLAVAVWTFITMTDPTAKYLGGVVLAILGLALLLTGLKEEK
jgi:putative Mn2+ efflux pump MntP